MRWVRTIARIFSLDCDSFFSMGLTENEMNRWNRREKILLVSTLYSRFLFVFSLQALGLSLFSVCSCFLNILLVSVTLLVDLVSKNSVAKLLFLLEKICKATQRYIIFFQFFRPWTLCLCHFFEKVGRRHNRIES